jgi:ribonuclease D
MLKEAIKTYVGDLADEDLQEARRTGVVAWDIETSGLDWKQDKIGTCQILIPNYDLFLVHVTADVPPTNLRSLLVDSNVMKIFHHAMFDLRFMSYQWSAEPRNVTCTKIASRIYDPLEHDHSLQWTLSKYLHVTIDKRPRISDWLSQRLSDQQLEYAVSDVLYLPQLLSFFENELKRSDRWTLALQSFQFIPIRVKLDLLGSGDVFRY